MAGAAGSGGRVGRAAGAAGAALLLCATPTIAADAPAAVTFSKDVAPILQDKCQACHQPGSIAPMSLITYQETRPWARAIRDRVSTRQMPPWHIDPVGVTRFKNDMSLSQRQIDTIVRWVDAGAPEGDPRDLPPARLTDDQFLAEMARRRRVLHLTRNDVVIGCPLCMIAPDVAPGKVATEQQ